MLIEKTASKIVDYLVKREVIENENVYTDFYQYGAEITISSLLNVALIFLIGILSRHFIDSLIYLPLFILLRKFTGGYHADTYLKCNIIGCLNFLLVLALKDISMLFMSVEPLTIALGVMSVMELLFLCPIENKNKPIKREKLPVYKLLSVLIGGLYAAAGAVLVYYSIEYGFTVLYTLLTVAVFVIISYVERRIYNEKES